MDFKNEDKAALYVIVMGNSGRHFDFLTSREGSRGNLIWARKAGEKRQRIFRIQQNRIPKRCSYSQIF